MAAGDYTSIEFPDNSTLERQARMRPFLSYCSDRTFSLFWIGCKLTENQTYRKRQERIRNSTRSHFGMAVRRWQCIC